ncbi:MAG: hypothetical protein HUK20_15025 [Fibrobacter sp.]|nr:hypothetical protein [Fibrobacter sp.]
MKKDTVKLTRTDPKKDIVVFALSSEETPDSPFTFAASPTQVYAATNQYLYLKHYPHFKLWCNLRNLSPQDADAWKNYFTTLDFSDPANRVIVLETHYTLADFASFLRIASHCMPLGLTHESALELSSYIQQMSKDTPLNDLEKAMVDLGEDLKASGHEYPDDLIPESQKESFVNIQLADAMALSGTGFDEYQEEKKETEKEEKKNSKKGGKKNIPMA